MRYAFAIVIFIFPLLVSSACDSASILPFSENTQESAYENNDTVKSTITIKVADKVFTATLEDNATATALKAMLPLRVNMTELNGNEKYFRFSNNLPINASNPGKINSGDLMLWGSNTLVLFYETFSTPYSYTRLGKIDDSTGLATALGSVNVTVVIEVRN